MSLNTGDFEYYANSTSGILGLSEFWFKNDIIIFRID